MCDCGVRSRDRGFQGFVGFIDLPVLLDVKDLG